MSLHEDLLEGMRELRGDLAEDHAELCTFAWAGDTYYCTPNPSTEEIIVTVDGNPVRATLSVLVEKADFTNGIVPQSGAKLVQNGKTYQVAEVEDLVGAAAWLKCIDWKGSRGR